jgi:hypothetical protein
VTFKAQYDLYLLEFPKKKRVVYHPSPYEKMEKELVEWLKEQREKRIAIKRANIKAKALELTASSTFRASNGWFENFKKRWHVRKRLPTHQVQKIKEDGWNKVIDYFEEIRKKRVEIELRSTDSTLKKCTFINMDEVPLEFDDLGYTYDFRGVKEVSVLNTTNSKRRVTMVLSITSDAKILPPMLIFKRRTPLPEQFLRKFDKLAFVACNPKGWMNGDLMKTWIEHVLSNFQRDSASQYFVVLDKFAAHISTDTKNALRAKGFDAFIIPGGFTGLLQPLDVCINKPLKDKIKTKFLDWLGERALRTMQKVKPPDYEDVIIWLLQSLTDLSNDLICKSFRYCGNNLRYLLILNFYRDYSFTN